LPDLLVNVRLSIVILYSDSLSFAVLDARKVTDVFPVKAEKELPFPLPHPAVKADITAKAKP